MSAAGLELPEGLARALAPVPRMRLPPASPRIRLGTSPALKRLLPLRLEVVRAQRRGEAIWGRSAQAREDALAAMRAIASGTARESEIEALARRNVQEREVQKLLLWYPWQQVHAAPETVRLIADALEPGRGVILSVCHQGPVWYGTGVGRALGRSVFMVCGDWMFGERPSGYWGREITRRLQAVRALGGRVIRASGSFEVIRALLERGEAVIVQFDVPGSEPTDFLGKQVALRTGTARIAALTGAAVLPARTRRIGGELWFEAVSGPEPRLGADRLAFHRELARLQEPMVLGCAEACESPLRAGGWSHADADGWWVEQPQG